MADRTVNVNIRYNVNTAEVQRATAASQAAQKATEELRKATEAYGKSSATAHKQNADGAKQAAAGFNELYSTVKLVITAGLAKELADSSINMARLQGNIEGVTRAFNRLPEAQRLLENLRKSTHGTLTDLQLMQQAIRAQNFNIPLTNLGRYLEFAAIRAQQTGESIDYMVNSIVTGLGRDSIKILDNLQVDIAAMKRRMDEAGISMDEAFNEQVISQMQKAGGYIETAATEADRLDVAWARLKATMADSRFWNFVISNLNALAETTTKIVTALGGKSFAQQREETQRMEIANASANEFMNRRFTESKEENIKVLEEEVQALTKSLGEYAKQRESAKSLVEWYVKQIQAGEGNAYVIQENIDVLEKYHQEKLKDALLDQEILKIYNQKILALKGQQEAEARLAEEARKRREADRAEELRQRRVGGFGEGLKKTVNITRVGELPLTRGASVAPAELQVLAPVPLQVQPIIPMDNWDKFVEDFQQNWRGFLSQGVADTTSFLISIQEAELQSYQHRLAMLKNFYDEQLLLAGDNERAKSELRVKEQREVTRLQREIAIKEWEAKRNSIILSTAGGIARAFIDYQWPYSLIPAAAVAAQGALQLGIADRNKPRFAKGVINLNGPGSETSDSIDAKLSRGESVMTAKETREALGILTNIRAGKLNDKILKQIVTNGGSQAFDDSRIVSAIKSQPAPPDIVKVGRNAYEVYKDQEGNKRFIRSKAI